MVKKNDILEVKIVDISDEGYGVAKVDGFTLFIENSITDEIVIVRVEKVLKSFGFAKVLELVRPSAYRVVSKDPLLTRVGTMPLQHIAYPYQLTLKRNWVIKAINQYLAFDEKIVAETIGADDPLHYRNKAQIPLRMIDGQIQSGFYKRNSHTLVPIDNYYIQDDIIDKTIMEVRDILNKYHLSVYDEKSKEGLLRHLVIKRGHYTGEIMVIIVINGKHLLHEEAIVQEIKEKIKGLVSLILNINTASTNVILGKDNILLYGKNHYEDHLLNKRFKIGALSFFQVNTLQTEKLYQKVIDFCEFKGDEIVLDAYCGLGSITLNLADKVKEVYGVEVVEEAIKLAKENARLNDIHNAVFMCDKAEKLMIDLAEKKKHFDVIVVDPPRKGLHRDFIEASIIASPQKIVYVSCNPRTLARDLKIYDELGYKVLQVQPVDMFPFTAHVETVALLGRKKVDEEIVYAYEDYEPKDSEYLNGTKGSATYREIKEWVKSQHGLSVSSLYIAQVKEKCGLEKHENFNLGAEGHRVPTCPPEKEEAILSAFRHFNMI